MILLSSYETIIPVATDNAQGSQEIFKKNFCDDKDPHHTARMNRLLHRYALRRTHQDKLFGAPILKLPLALEKTIFLQQTKFERIVYEKVLDLYDKKFAAAENKTGLVLKYVSRPRNTLIC